MKFSRKPKERPDIDNCPGFANPLKRGEVILPDIPPEQMDPPTPEIQVKFNEVEILKEIERYVMRTYNQHYVGTAGNRTQVMDLLMANPPTALEFSRGAAVKYLMRYGKKNGNNRTDLLKAAHYILFMMKCDEDRRQYSETE